jgi:hypothetical protein
MVTKGIVTTMCSDSEMKDVTDGGGKPDLEEYSIG